MSKEIIIPETYKYITAFLSMKCNLNCSFCLNALDSKFNRKDFREMSGEEWVEGLNKINSLKGVPITFSGGEPSLHKDFIYIINNLKPELKIDILTNLQWNQRKLENFISKVNLERLRRNSPYASIRVSYHPEQMGDGERLIKNARILQDAGFNIGIWSILYPSPEQLSAINQMQFRCRDKGIDFRLKEFTGMYLGMKYGNYNKYPDSVFQKNLKKCECKTSELLIGTNGDVYRCHRDLYSKENSIGNICKDGFEIEDIFRECNKYGECHPCDVKVKTNYKQQLGHTSVEIRL